MVVERINKVKDASGKITISVFRDRQEYKIYLCSCLNFPIFYYETPLLPFPSFLVLCNNLEIHSDEQVQFSQ